MARFDLNASIAALRASLPAVGAHNAKVTDFEVFEKPDATWVSVKYDVVGADVTELLCIDAPSDGKRAADVPKGLNRIALLARANGVETTAWDTAEDIAADILGAMVRVTIGHSERDGIPTAAVRGVSLTAYRPDEPCDPTEPPF